MGGGEGVRRGRSWGAAAEARRARRGEPERGEKNVSETARRGGTKRRSRAETRWKRSRSGRRRPGTDPPRASRASGDGRGVGSRGWREGEVGARGARRGARSRAASRDSRATSPRRLDAQKQAKGTKGSPEPSRSPRETDGPRGVGAGGNGRTRRGDAPSTSASATLPRLCLSGYRCCGEPMVDGSSDPRSLSLRVVMGARKPFASRGMPPQTAKTSDAGRARTPGRARRFLRFA